MRSVFAVRKNGQQVGDADIDARLEQQCRDLAAVVRLVIEEMLEQAAEVPARRDACHIAVCKVDREVLGPDLGNPALDEIVQRAPVGAKAGQIGRKRLAQ